MNARERLWVRAAVLTIAAVGGYAWVHQPLFATRAELRDRQAVLDHQLNAERAGLARQGDLTQRETALQAAEQRFQRQLNGSNTATALLTELTRAAGDSGARIRSFSQGDFSPLKNGLLPGAAPPRVLRITVDAEGSFAQLMRFSQLIEQAPLLVRLNGVKLTFGTGTDRQIGTYDLSLVESSR